MLVWLTKISATRRLRPLVMPKIFEPVSKDAESAPNLLGELARATHVERRTGQWPI
jgi:hypothetical protein